MDYIYRYMVYIYIYTWVYKGDKGFFLRGYIGFRA